MALGRVDRPVAILIALEVEARALVRHLSRSTISSPHLSVWEGAIDGKRMVLVITGVGKVASALATQYVCDVFDPQGVVAVGLAGAIDGGSQPGELILASGALQHDVDARPLTKAKGMIPSLGMAVIPADTNWSERLRQATARVVAKPQTVRTGVVLTGDQIVSSRDVRDRLFTDFPEGVCLDMETAALAQVARQNSIPWAALRMISDAADENFNLGEVLGFGTDSAADLFDQIVRAFVNAL